MHAPQQNSAPKAYFYFHGSMKCLILLLSKQQKSCWPRGTQLRSLCHNKPISDHANRLFRCYCMQHYKLKSVNESLDKKVTLNSCGTCLTNTTINRESNYGCCVIQLHITVWCFSYAKGSKMGNYSVQRLP